MHFSFTHTLLGNVDVVISDCLYDNKHKCWLSNAWAIYTLHGVEHHYTTLHCSDSTINLSMDEWIARLNVEFGHPSQGSHCITC